MTDAMKNIGGLFGIGVSSVVSNESIYYLKQYGFIFIVAIIGSTNLPKLVVEKMQENKRLGKVIMTIRPVVLAALLLVITAFLVDGSFNPFLYFRF